MIEFADDAIVLRTYTSGEADRVAVLWTREHGKLRVLAKGARKTSSRLGGSLETLAHVGVDLIQGRGERYIVRHVVHRERYATLRADYDRIAAGYAVVEVANAIPAEDVADEGIFELLRRVLVTLDDPNFRPGLVPASFFLRLLAYDGSAPVFDACVNCGRREPLVAFDAAIGGCLCPQCRSGRPLSPDALELLRRITGGDLAAVLRAEEPPGAGEVASLAHEAVELHFGRRLRATHVAPPRDRGR